MQDTVYAEVIVDITSRSLDRPFSYRVSENLRETIEPGMVVEVPFGKSSRIVRGYVIRLTSHTDVESDRLKDIAGIVTDGLGPESRLISLAAWMRARYGCTMVQALRTVIPVKRKVAGKTRSIIHLCLERSEAQQKLAVYERKHQKARARLLQALIEQPEIPRELAVEKLRITSEVIRAMKEQGVIDIRSEKVWRIPPAPPGSRYGEVTLTAQQQMAADRVIGSWDDPSSQGFLLHGVTGSGKTAVYMELAAYALSRGEQVILLIPEISLTYQTLMRLYSRFGSAVSVINSRLSAGERYDQFELARTAQISIMIGPRSALFTPFPKLGLIVIDEEHDGAYISESTPGYDAVECAMRRASIEGARLVLGSATPSLRSYRAALRGDLQLLELTQRAGGAAMPLTQIVDMREQLRQGCRSIISRPLQEELGRVLDRREQAMLFLNRRGLASSVSCRSCGKPIHCPHCDVSLSLHNNGKMVCHYCGFEMQAVSRCPSCGSPFIRTFRAGTQQVEKEVANLFPSARILRMDADTTRQKESYTRLLSAFSDHEADILIGTQMIVKGHDFPDVTLMGILAADLSLNAESYMAGERTFQLITQAVGRAGRSDRPGSAVIQTYQPDLPAVVFGASQNYRAFYEQEISYRKIGGYPPEGAMTAIHLSSEDPALLETAASYLGRFAVYCAAKVDVQVLGPADETVARISDQFRKVLYLKADDDRKLMKVRELLLEYIGLNEGFRSVRIRMDAE